MARTKKPLTFTEIDRAKPQTRNYKLYDGGGLILVVKTSGVKAWQFDYKKPFTGKRTTLSLGSYPTLSLQHARAKVAEYKRLLLDDIDPLEFNNEQKEKERQRQDNTFRKIAFDWFEYRKTRANFSERTQRNVFNLINCNLLPLFGDIPITQITAPMAIKAFQPLQQAGKLETLKKSIQKLNEVMNYALHRDLIQYNPTANISKEFDSPRTTHRRTISPLEIGDLLTALNNSQMNPITRLAIKWQLLTMTRPSETATAKWADIDVAERLWTFEVRKGRKETDTGRLHKVTLSSQCMKLLEQIKVISDDEYLFPSTVQGKKHISGETANLAIRRSGFGDRLVAHGLRSIASTFLNEKGWDKDLIEVALSHIDKDRVRASYNRADYLKQRFDMLQEWGDFIERQANGQLFESWIFFNN